MGCQSALLSTLLQLVVEQKPQMLWHRATIQPLMPCWGQQPPGPSLSSGTHWAPKWCLGLWQGSGTCVLKCCHSQWPRAGYKRLCPPASLPALAMGIRLAWGQPHDIREQALEEPAEGVEGAKGQKLELGASSGGSLLHLQLPASSLWKMNTSMW